MSAGEHPLVFVHLSDIHFNKGVYGTPYDLDEDLRNELERDSARMAERIGRIDGVLITGDIAFTGSAEEYRVALLWLEGYCGKLYCPSENVWCTPGNHDVDRSVVGESAILDSLHRDLRPEDPSQVDDQIERLMQDSQAAELLYKPIANYNKEFASKFGCEIDAEDPYWEHDFQLDDGSILRLRGVNSTLVSDMNDNDAEYKLIVGSAQGLVRTQNGVEYVILCHHPLSWLLDQDRLSDIWNNRARIQLFGHKHRRRIRQIDQSIVVAAGAAHPSREEQNWLPAYNIIQIWVAEEGSNRQLRINVYPRVWSNADMQFQAYSHAGGPEVLPYSLAIGEWHASTAILVPESGVRESTGAPWVSEVESAEDEVASEKGWEMDPARRLTYRFLRLPFHTRMGISLALGLIEDSDGGLRDSELFRKVFRRARERELLAKLWQQVAVAYDVADEGNPYVGH